MRMQPVGAQSDDPHHALVETTEEGYQVTVKPLGANSLDLSGDPPIGTTAQFAFTYTDSLTGSKIINYRIYHYGSYPSGLVNYDTYVVGTAFIRGLPNCP
ncbi:MAG: hypothetical protein ACXVAR_16070 [Vulcanimicrobiaceae bacterium]